MDNNNQQGGFPSNNEPIKYTPGPSGVPSTYKPGQKKIGPIITTLVVILVITIAALYIFASRTNENVTPTDENVPAATGDESRIIKPINHTSDDLQSIQNDLDSATNGLDSQNF